MPLRERHATRVSEQLAQKLLEDRRAVIRRHADNRGRKVDHLSPRGPSERGKPAGLLDERGRRIAGLQNPYYSRRRRLRGGRPLARCVEQPADR